ncbi:hypothetical protein SAMN02745132_04630, partial [Enterovibrio nigricans DSM 22720]
FLHPTIESGVVDIDTSFLKHFSQFAVTHPILAVPTDGPEDNLARKVTPFEISHA